MLSIGPIIMTKKIFSLKLVFVFLLSGLISNQVLALKSDRDQPADIEADDIEFDFQKGTRTYVDNVLAVQGTLRLKADKLHAIYKDGELDTATLWGSLARFKQRPDDKPDDVEGWAKKIIVDQDANTLTLIGQAALRQGGDTARGDTIVYNMATDTLKVRGNSQLGTRGAQPTSDQPTPRRNIEDPFANDPIPADTPTAPTNTATAQPTSSTSSTNSVENSVSETVQERVPQPEQTSSGRSRLIIQPKK